MTCRAGVDTTASMSADLIIAMKATRKMKKATTTSAQEAAAIELAMYVAQKLIKVFIRGPR